MVRSPRNVRATRRLLAGVAVCALVLGACGGDDDDAAEAAPDTEAASSETVLVGSTLDLAPMEFIDESGTEVGFEPDILSAIGDELGLEFEYVKTPFEQAFTGLQADKFRLNASAIFVRCERVEDKENFGEFTVPYFEEGQVVTVRSDDASEITGIADLSGKTLGVESAGSTADAVADENAAIGFTKEIFPDNNALFLALEQGRIDAAMQSGAVTRYTIRDNDGLEVVETVEGTSRPVAMIFRAGDEMRTQFNEVIDQFKEDGTLAGIYEEWFGAAPEPGSVTAEIVPEVTTSTCED